MVLGMNSRSIEAISSKGVLYSSAATLAMVAALTSSLSTRYLITETWFVKAVSVASRAAVLLINPSLTSLRASPFN